MMNTTARNSVLTLLIALSALALSAKASAANIITNGDFASGSTGWTSIGTAWYAPGFGNYDDNFWFGTPPPNGTTTVAVFGGAGDFGSGSQSGISQGSISLTGGQEYALTFAWAGQSAYDAGWSPTTWNSSTMGVCARVTSGSTVLFDTINASGFIDAYNQTWFDANSNPWKFTVGSSVNDAVLSIYYSNPTYGTTGTHAYVGVSNVSLEAVPEPSTYALVVGGIATLLLIRRRIQA
jgi:hypothetical protein